MHLVERDNGTFTTQELQRLTAYRAAIAAGFYTDWDGSAQTTDCELLGWLRSAADAPALSVEYPFTDAERQRLERCKAAVAGGYYRDDEPPTEAAEAASEEPGATSEDVSR